MLLEAGCEVLVCEGESRDDRLEWLLDNWEPADDQRTGRGWRAVAWQPVRRRQIDEVHAFIAPKLIGGAGR